MIKKYQAGEVDPHIFSSEYVPVERLSWCDYFILQAFLVSLRSIDSQTKCGCVIVSNNRIVATGYNSFIRDVDDTKLVNVRPNKYDFMIHAEANALLFAAQKGVSCDGASIYITAQPCLHCLQMLYQAGISQIYYPEGFETNMTKAPEYKKKFDLLLYLMSDKIQLNMVCSDGLKEKISKIVNL